jgi:hypothetical protein
MLTVALAMLAQIVFCTSSSSALSKSFVLSSVIGISESPLGSKAFRNYFVTYYK